jgi:two-component sensor histidine kinase/CheY-like chemotaxis protein
MTDPDARVLYVDDDVALCRLAQRRLQRAGFAVTTVHDGAAALALARAERFDVVALDHYMPGQDGLATMAELMALPTPPAVIYVTGTQETSVAVQALKAGAADYLVKDAGDHFFDLLARTVTQALTAQATLAAKDRAERDLRETNARLEALLVEMNHRVANSLQMVASLINLQARRAKGTEAQPLLGDMRRRIDAVARVHRQLYVAGGVSTIDMAAYCQALGKDLALGFTLESAQRPITVTADPVILPTADAISVGILINELVSNACKYAYAPDEPGEVRVQLIHLHNGGFRLTVEDDGCGAALSQGTGFGSQMVRAVAESLGGTVVLRDLCPGLGVVVECLKEGKRASGGQGPGALGTR